MPTVVACEVLAGLEPFAEAEVARVVGPRGARRREDSRGGEVRFDWSAPLGDALALRTVVAAYAATTFAVPRPKALLGDEHLRRLLDHLALAVALHPDGSFRSFRFGAAGRSSPVFVRLADAIARATRLRHDPEDGDLLIRVRPGPGGWEVLARLSPRPSSARAWRVADLPGALNATIAAAMVEATQPSARDRVLNAMCGSGTLLVERLVRLETATVIGVDNDGAALGLARANLAAAGFTVPLVHGDAARLPFPDAFFDVVLADLPYGERMGRHDTNEALYAAFLDECARVCRRGARVVVITHDIRRFERSLATRARVFRVTNGFQVFQKGHHPKIWVLQRQGRGARLGSWRA